MLISRLKDEVVDQGFCIGCGVCASNDDSPISIELDKFGKYQAKVPKLVEDIEAVCPFSGDSENEDEISDKLYADLPKDEYAGRYLSTLAGHVIEGEYRKNGSSGGMTTWILGELLRENLIDYVLHVKPVSSSETDLMFEYEVSNSLESLQKGSKSRYYPAEMSQILRFVRENEGRYAIVSIPCFAKAIRLLQLRDKVFEERIAFVGSIFCGHLKSANYAKYLAWECNIQPKKLNGVDFRKKNLSKPASQYETEFSFKKKEEDAVKAVSTSQIRWTNWGLGLFKYQACDYCDDIVGETADFSFGDAWIPEYVNDPQGNNIIVTRNKIIDKLIVDAKESGRLQLDNVDVEKIFESQAGGFRHRREGLAYRLSLLKKKKKFVIKKRVEPCNTHINLRKKFLYKSRFLVSKNSHAAFAKALDMQNLKFFYKRMSVLVFFNKLFTKSIVKRLKQMF